MKQKRVEELKQLIVKSTIDKGEQNGKVERFKAVQEVLC